MTEPEQTPLFHARGQDGRLLIGGKHEVFAHTTADTSPDNRAHWPVTNRIPDDPDKAFERSEARQLKAPKEVSEDDFEVGKDTVPSAETELHVEEVLGNLGGTAVPGAVEAAAAHKTVIAQRADEIELQEDRERGY